MQKSLSGFFKTMEKYVEQPMADRVTLLKYSLLDAIWLDYRQQPDLWA